MNENLPLSTGETETRVWARLNSTHLMGAGSATLVTDAATRLASEVGRFG